MITALVVLWSASPVAAQLDPDSGPELVYEPGLGAGQTDSSGFGALIAIFVIIGVGGAIWKFATLRDMGLRRGMSNRDATAAALFSDDSVTSTMILKPEVSRPTPRRSAPAKHPRTIEQRLAKIDSLLDEGLITEAEASSRREEILDEI